MMIKVCGITRREDALAAVEAGASTIGFVFYHGSPRCVTAERAAAIGEGLEVWKAGIFVNESPANIAAIMRAARLDIAQIYGGAAPEHARVWKAFRVTGGFENFGSQGAEAVLLDGAKSGVPFDWRLARGAAAKVILAGGLDCSNVADAIRIGAPWGVDASSKLESAPGMKDHEKVRAFVKAAREATW
jgi:phosphoribosylanthranilate isomerase